MKHLCRPWRQSAEEPTLIVDRHGSPVGGFTDAAFARHVVNCVNADHEVGKRALETTSAYPVGVSRGHRPGRAL